MSVRDVRTGEATFLVNGVTKCANYPHNLYHLDDIFYVNNRYDEGPAIVLIRDPFHEFDANAIEVHVPMLNARVGYVPSAISRVLAPSLDAGIRWHAIHERIGFMPQREVEYPGMQIRVIRVDNS